MENKVRLTNSQFDSIVSAIVNSVCSNVYSYYDTGSSFHTIIEDNDLDELLQSNGYVASQLEDCHLSVVKEERDDEEELYDDEYSREDEEIYEIHRSYPWSSGSWYEHDTEDVENSVQEEVERVFGEFVEIITEPLEEALSDTDTGEN